ncbi:hypothetical protein PMZ80_001205 [Knufia obscura]|uniref:Uncharacterized protein n=1 Tax=Knufia obscura TaxID=1635080 RepID=A0ABR0S3N8_9EURO|nr:hypothetical protein PMZ80_001205 [Knufia obscura]
MAPSRRNVLAATLIIASTAAALPQQKVDTGMPVLSQATATSAEAWQTSSAQQWWTPSASQSQWDWNTWSASQAQSTPVALAVSAPASSAPAVITSQSSAPYSNPFTVYTSMTDSRGVITGMPAVATSQPSQADVATVCSGCASVMSAQESWSSMVSSIYSTSTPVPTSASSTMSSATSASSTGSSASSSPTFEQSTGAASRSAVLSGGAVLAMIATVVALL